jgi:hypothetical protein
MALKAGKQQSRTTGPEREISPAFFIPSPHPTPDQFSFCSAQRNPGNVETLEQPANNRIAQGTSLPHNSSPASPHTAICLFMTEVRITNIRAFHQNTGVAQIAKTSNILTELLAADFKKTHKIFGPVS